MWAFFTPISLGATRSSGLTHPIRRRPQLSRLEESTPRSCPQFEVQCRIFQGGVKSVWD